MFRMMQLDTFFKLINLFSVAIINCSMDDNLSRKEVIEI